MMFLTIVGLLCSPSRADEIQPATEPFGQAANGVAEAIEETANSNPFFKAIKWLAEKTSDHIPTEDDLKATRLVFHDSGTVTADLLTLAEEGLAESVVALLSDYSSGDELEISQTEGVDWATLTLLDLTEDESGFRALIAVDGEGTVSADALVEDDSYLIRLDGSGDAVVVGYEGTQEPIPEPDNRPYSLCDDGVWNSQGGYWRCPDGRVVFPEDVITGG